VSQRLNLPLVRVCESRKIRFYDRIEAEAFARVLAGKNGVTGRGKPGLQLHVYWCEGCEAYHVGHGRDCGITPRAGSD
jgi:hypothetical protein